MTENRGFRFEVLRPDPRQPTVLVTRVQDVISEFETRTCDPRLTRSWRAYALLVGRYRCRLPRSTSALSAALATLIGGACSVLATRA